jgi:phenylpropionate dioxygenase-like ring-hydroxylating dioxygenase large terminal subunit
MFLGLLSDFPDQLNVRYGDIILRRSGEELLYGSSFCPHRGMPFITCTNAEYNLKCPYHGLPFNPDKKATLFHGLAYTGDSLEPWGYLSKLLPSLGEPFQRELHNVACSSQIWIENTMDPNHLSHVHKAGFADLFQGHPFDVKIGKTWSSYKMAIKQSIKDSYSTLGYTNDHFEHFVAYPNLSITNFLGVFHSIETALPTDRGCIVHTRYYANAGAANLTGLIKAATKANQALLKEDRDICEALAPTYNESSQLYLASEQRIKAFRQWRVSNN